MFFEDQTDLSLERSGNQGEYDALIEADRDKNRGVRRHSRQTFFRKAVWDFFTGNTGFKSGYVTNLSKSGCLLKANDAIDHRRWIRVMIQDAHSNMSFVQVGRVVRRHDIMEQLSGGAITLYRYGVEFTHPGYLSLMCEESQMDQDDFTLDLSSTHLTVRSCRSLNKISSLRPASFE